MPRTFERMTITLPPETASDLRSYAASEHGGKVSTAVAEILAVWFAADRMGVNLRSERVTKSEGGLSREASPS